MPSALFHLAIPVTDLAAAREFYTTVFGCRVGRASATWIDFDFFGHQVTAHLVAAAAAPEPTNDVDGKPVPVRHFGVVLEWSSWHALADRLRAAGVAFLIEPHLRFAGQVGEQATLFLCDPSGNGIEFKSFRDPASIFATGAATGFGAE